MNKDFNKWLDTFIKEKNINVNEIFTLENQTEKGAIFDTQIFDYQYIIDCIKSTNKQEQQDIKKMLVKLDLYNQDIKAYLRHLAQALII